MFEKIQRSIAGRDLVIVLTHLDKDHYNWVTQMINTGRIRPDQIKKIVVGFGSGWSLGGGDGEEKALKDMLENPAIQRQSFLHDP